jgi:hypothetical protein
MSDLSPHRGVKAELFKAVTKSDFVSTRPWQGSEYGVAQPLSVNDLLIIRNRPLIYSHSGSHSTRDDGAEAK